MAGERAARVEACNHCLTSLRCTAKLFECGALQCAAQPNMFETLSGKLQAVFKEFSRRGKLSDADVDTGLREIRLALLEADVHFSVVKSLLDRVRARAVGSEVAQALNPGQQVIKIVHAELLATLGTPERLNLQGPAPRSILLVGLQGAGKTTLAGKLARWLRADGQRPLLVAADPYRPAAVEQLRTIGRQLDIPVFTGTQAPPQLCAAAQREAAATGCTVVIMDTAGRLQIDADMMAEVTAIKALTQPGEVLLVADAMLGQAAVRIAEGFHAALGLTGLVLTKMDGDARGGAAISIRSVAAVPIKFLGVSEKMDGLEVFDPARLAGRILGMGDIIGLIEKAEASFDVAQAQQMQQKLLKSELDLSDFLDQLRQMRKLGSMGQLMEMLPGLGRAAAAMDPAQMDKQLTRSEAIVCSMTLAERRDPRVMNSSRKRRVAAGSGTQVQDVNQLLKQFRQMQDMMKQFGKNKRGMLGLLRQLGG